MEHTFPKILFVVYLKFKFNGASCILSGVPILVTVWVTCLGMLRQEV